jgi:subtilisin family serine protease
MNINGCLGKSVLMFTVFMLLVVAMPSGAAQVNVLLDNLRTNTKLSAPDDILADFVNGKTETEVIVHLKPTTAANALAIQSKMFKQAPTQSTVAGAPAYYDLQDESIKSQLRATVTDTVRRVTDALGVQGVTVTQRFSYQFGFAARVTPAALDLIVNSPDVLAVEKVVILQAHLAQGITLMNAATVRSSYNGSGLSIAICDTGIDTSHPRLGGGAFPNAKVIGGYDTGDSDADPRPDSVSGQAHGTACAGIAAGDTGTVGDYIGGVAPGAKLYAIKISTGTTGNATSAAMIAGWEWAMTHKNDDPNNPIMIISTSFGGGAYTSSCDTASTAMTTAAANAVAAGITIFASSGNDGYCDSIAWPACISYVNSVGAVYDAALGTYGFCVNSATCATKVLDEANCGVGGYISWDPTASDKATVYSNSASFLTLFAPSHNAYTTDIVGAGGYSTGDYDTNFGGTSAACPYAAGSAAVLQQAAKVNTGSFLTPAQVRSYLVNNGDNVTDSKVAITKPRINLGRAVNALIGGPINGTCGGSNNQAFITTPATNLCSAGTASAISGIGPWFWSCSGSKGGTTANCMAYSTSQQGTLTPFPQNFDFVTFPALPPGWLSTGSVDPVYGYTSKWQTNIGTRNPSGASYGSTAHSGNNLAYFNSYDVSAGRTAFLSSPVYSLTGKVGGKVSFWMYHDIQYNDADRIDVYINSASSLAGANLIGTANRYDGTSGWSQYTFDIPATFTGATNYLLINGVSAWGNDIHLDDITVYAFTPVYPLTFTFTGTGYGSLNSSPSGISCAGTTGSVCAISNFSGGGVVALSALSDSSSSYKSAFTGWTTNTTACPGTGTCSVTLSGPVNVTGTFNRDKLVKITPTAVTYGTILEAYTAAATSGQTIQLRDNSGLTPFTDALSIKKSITLKGGFDSGFSTNTGYTTTSGGLTVSGNIGVLKVQRIIVR